MDIEVLTRQNKIKINKIYIKEAANKFLAHLRQPKDAVLTILFVDSKNIKKINKLYFGKNSTTDVIAIEPGEVKGLKGLKVKKFKSFFSNYLGEVVICPEKAKQNAKIFNNSIKREIALYVAHGILHLLGYDDLNKKDCMKMRKKERQLLNLL